MNAHITLLVGFTQAEADNIRFKHLPTDSCDRYNPRLFDRIANHVVKVIVSSDVDFKRSYTELYCRLPRPASIRMYHMRSDGTIVDHVDWARLFSFKTMKLEDDIVNHYFPSGVADFFEFSMRKQH